MMNNNSKNNDYNNTLSPSFIAKGGGSGMGPPASAPHPMLEIPGRSNNALTCDHEDSHWLISVTF